MSHHRRNRWFQLSPIDSWVFGDGRPNNAGEDQSDLGCIFPPSPLTVVGAIRAAAARALGWSGMGDWEVGIKRVLGDGWSDLGPLQFMGPFLGNERGPLFPAPFHLMGEVEPSGDWRPADLLEVGDSVVTSHYGGKSIHLPRLARLTGGDVIRLVEAKGVWLTTRGLRAVLNGVLPRPDDCLRSSDLFEFEERVGLEVVAETRTAKVGHMYSPIHIRCRRGVSLLIAVAGLPDGLELPELLSLGGESRLAICEEISDPGIERLGCSGEGGNGEGDLCLIALTPVRLLDEHEQSIRWSIPGPGDQASALVGGLNGRIATVCIDRPLHLGGWDTNAGEPLPLVPHARPGTVWFLDDVGLSVEGLMKAGELTELGFGLLVCGKVPESQNNQEVR